MAGKSFLSPLSQFLFCKDYKGRLVSSKNDSTCDKNGWMPNIAMCNTIIFPKGVGIVPLTTSTVCQEKKWCFKDTLFKYSSNR